MRNMNLKRLATALLASSVGVLAFSQAKEPDGPASKELRAIREADQAIRKAGGFTVEKIQAMIKSDAVRRDRVSQLLAEGKVVTSEDFDVAALVYQHGSSAADFLIAHELYLICQIRGVSHNGFAISEDRWLLKLGREQRFGCQFGSNQKLEPVATGLACPTDDFRLDFAVAPVELTRQKGPAAIMDIIETYGRRIAERTDAAWIAKQPVRDFSSLSISDVLKLHASSSLVTPADYAGAARVMLASKDTSELLLAHEMAGLAATRGVVEARHLFAESLDRVLVSIGQPARYGTAGGRISPLVSATVRKWLNLR